MSTNEFILLVSNIVGIVTGVVVIVDFIVDVVVVYSSILSSWKIKLSLEGVMGKLLQFVCIMWIVKFIMNCF